MSKQVPFTAHIRVVPRRGKRFEYIRDLQKISARVYDELSEDTDLSLATPGGGQHQSLSGVGGGGWSGYSAGTAIKPQIGQSPAQLQITGFIVSSSNNAQLHPNMAVISGGEHQSGPAGAHGWSANPTTELNSLAAELKGKLEDAVDAVLGDSDWSVFRIDIGGVTFGDRGYTFPQS